MELFRTEVLLGRMVRLRNRAENLMHEVLELCCSEWFQNEEHNAETTTSVLELCCSEWFQNNRTTKTCLSFWFANR